MNINDLPEEVLCMIFDHLTLADVKNASLTCKWWQQVLFSTPYISRFKLNLDLGRIMELCKSKRPYGLSRTEALRFLLQREFAGNERRYRHVALAIEDLTERQFDWALRLIDPQYPTRLRSLALKYNHYPTQELLPSLVNVLPQMVRLERLVLDGASERYPEALLLKSDTVRHLQVILLYDAADNHGQFVRLDMPNLETYRGKLHVLDSATKLDRLTALTLTRRCSYTPRIDFEYYRKRFAPLQQLVELRIEFEVDRALFRAICECCPLLQVWVMTDRLNHHDPDTFAMLTRLHQLRHLELEAFCSSTTNIIDLTSLKQLKFLQIKGTHFGDMVRVIYPRSVRKVRLLMFGWIIWYKQHILYRMCSDIEELTELHVVFNRNCDIMSFPQLMDGIRYMPRLRHLTVTHGIVLESSFGMLETKVPWLRTVLFIASRIETVQFPGIATKFPNLYEVRIEDCHDMNARPLEDTCYRF